MKYINEKLFVTIFLVVFITLTGYLILIRNEEISSPVGNAVDRIKENVSNILPSPTLSLEIPNTYTIPQQLHVYQSFNN